MGDLSFSSAAGSGRSSGAGLIATGTATVELPAEVADLLQKEAKRHRKSIARYVAEWLEDQADARTADKAEKASKGKPTIRAQDLYKECGL